jgi:small conductance mechanosensitive channel
MLETVRQIPEVLDDPAPDALVMELAASSVTIRLRWWVNPPRQKDTLDARDVVLERVKNALVQAGIDLPFPTQQILFHDQTEESDGDRSRQREGWPRGKGETPCRARIVDALRDLKSDLTKVRGDARPDEAPETAP